MAFNKLTIYIAVLISLIVTILQIFSMSFDWYDFENTSVLIKVLVGVAVLVANIALLWAIIDILKNSNVNHKLIWISLICIFVYLTVLVYCTKRLSRS